MAELDVVSDGGDDDNSDEECDGSMLLHLLLLSFDGQLVLMTANRDDFGEVKKNRESHEQQHKRDKDKGGVRR